ncbi:MAG TPA: STAS domain-containing protein [Spirochaetota bacterium]|nr:STAS domain-containing protein [Spirochaetota bacterium]
MEAHKISINTCDGFPVVTIEGDMTSESDDTIMSLFSSIKESTSLSSLIFDFEKTTYINSAGIATLINIIQEMKDLGGKVLFTGLSDHFQKVMDIVGISDFVTIYDTISHALQANKNDIN